MTQLQLNSDLTEEFEELKTWFADVIIPIPLPGTYTYRIPRLLEDQVAKGARVIVQFGSRKVYTGIIADLHNAPPKNYEAKYIIELLDSTPSVNSLQLDFFKWIAQYYMCTVGEVMNAALPSGLKLTSQSFIQINPEFSEGESGLTDKEMILLESLSNTDKLSYDEVSDILGLKQIHPILKSLIQKDGILLFEQIKDKYQPKKIKKIRLKEVYFENRSKLEELFESLEKKL
ncbi:MAG: primosomal protein N', partial [Cyclobacteriaceae bacterium]|nr:primosomal protein N' [Cyclobacteriaceae bacterium]